MLLCARPALDLRAGPYAARVAPAAGARLTSLEWNDGGARRSLLVPWDGQDFDEHHWPKAGAFPMLPFANRLPREGFRFGGQQVSPEAGPGGFAQHGCAHRRAWQVAEHADRHAELRLEHGASVSWPWSWSARQEVRLDEDGI